MGANVPRASASIAALIMLSGLALIYWSLTGLGVLVDREHSVTTFPDGKHVERNIPKVP